MKIGPVESQNHFLSIQTFSFFCPAQTPGRGRSRSDPPPGGGCPRCLHEFSCSRTSQQMGDRPPRPKVQVARCEVPRDATPGHGHRLHTHLAAGLRLWIHHGLDEDFNSCDPLHRCRRTPASNPEEGPIGGGYGRPATPRLAHPDAVR